MSKKDLIKYIAIVMIIVVAGFIYISTSHDKSNDNEFVNIESEEDEYSSESVSEKASIYVQICGQVNNPGVYEVKENARIYQIVELAGGLTDKASDTNVNQAAEVSDGQQIYIPSIDDEMNQWTSAAAGDNSKNININSADKDMLMSLPGIGEAKADAIIAYRESNGRFAAIEDIMNVPGIKEAAFSKIEDYICV